MVTKGAGGGNMSQRENRKQSMVVQAGILATAGIIVRIIGLLYNTPLVHIIGDEGFGYYDSAYAAYSIVLLISSYSIPSAISKIIASNLARKEYRNAYKIFKCTLIYVSVVGLIASMFVFFGAGILVKMESAILPLKILAPTIFFSGLLGCFRGFFQAQHSMVPTSISQILEQIANAFFSVFMAYILVGVAINNNYETSKIASFGAAGSTIGTGAGVLFGLLFMLLIFFYNKKTILRKVSEDTSGREDSYFDIFKMILLVVTPFILSTGIYNVNSFMDKTIYQMVMMGTKGIEESKVAFDLSAYAKANKIANIPIAMSAAMASTMIPRLSGLFAMGKAGEANAQISKAVKVTMFISIPAAVGIGVIAKPIMKILFNQPESIDAASMMLTLLSVTVVLYGLSTISQAVLQSAGHMTLPIVNALISVVLHAGVMILLMNVLPEGAMLASYGIATIVYTIILAILNGISVKRHLGYTQETDKTFLRPLICASFMGLLVFGIYHGLFILIQSNIVSVFISVVVGVFVYMILCIKWKAVDENELKSLPKGSMLISLFKKIHILK